MVEVRFINDTTPIEVTSDEQVTEIQVGGLSHGDLNGRDYPDQHPISAITGLQEALDTIPSDYVSDAELEAALLEKQDVIRDLSEIREGATLGATAVQPNELESYATLDYVDDGLSGKQDTLTAGANIQIVGNTISATDTTYTAGTGISIVGNVISNTQTSAEWGNITGSLSAQSDLWNVLEEKANVADIPTATSDLLNDSGYITNSALTPYATQNYVNTALTNKQDTLTQTQLDAVNSGANTTNINQIVTNRDNITTINSLIPNQASSSNQLADKDFVNSSIATNTATFRGTYNSVAELNAYSGEKDNNDYAFVTGEDGLGNTYYDNYVYNGTSWVYRWRLNNSSFTAAQWASINSGITSDNVTDFSAHIINENNPHNVTKEQIGLGNVDNTSDLDKPISTATQTALNSKQDTISDLATIRSGASAGATAVQPSELESYATSDYVDDGLAEKVSKSGDTMTGDLVLNRALYLTNVSDSVHSSVSRLYFGSSKNPTNYISANKAGAFGIYNSEKSGVTCYPGVNFFPEGTTKTTNLGRVDKRWNIGYIISLFGNTKQETVDNIITGAALGATALQPNDNISELTNDSGYITGITSSDVTTALGYTPYSSSNPSGYTSNTGTVTSVNNEQPDANGNVNVELPSSIQLNYYGSSDSAAEDTEKVVSIPSITELNVGQIIIVQPSVTSTAGDSTLKLNNFDAYPIRYHEEALTSSTDSQIWNATFPSGFIFDGTHWVFLFHGYDKDTDSTYTINYSINAGQYKAGVGTYAVTRYSLLMQKPDLTWEKITATNKNYSTGTTKTVNTNGFLLNQIVYYATTTNRGNGAMLAANTVRSKAASVALSYSTNCGAPADWEVGDYIYLVGTVGADGLFYLDTTKWWDNALPTTNDGKLYIQIGLALTTTDSSVSFLDNRPIYYHDGTRICEYKIADNKQDKISDLATIRSGAALGATALQTINSSDVTTALGYTPYNSSNPSGYITSSALTPYVLSSSLASVATSGNYNDLSNKPTIPTVNNATLTIQKNGTDVATFTANASSNVTANISVPTNNNQLTNGAGYITSAALNGYATESYVTTTTANMQTTGNLVTSISSTSTDSQYPSAKCVYDIVGDIESAINTIRGV